MDTADGGVSAGRSDLDGRGLHARLLQGDPTAPSDLADRYLEHLIAALLRAFPRQDRDLLETVAIDLILDVAQRPARYDPDRLPLSAYLLMAAKRDAQTALKKEQRRLHRIAPLDVVELQPSPQNMGQARGIDPAEAVLDGEADAALSTMYGGLGEVDRAVVQLIADGERRTEVFAGVLGLHDRPRPEQEREVKRAKDRLKKRLQRLRQKMQVQDDD